MYHTSLNIVLYTYFKCIDCLSEFQLIYDEHFIGLWETVYFKKHYSICQLIDFMEILQETLLVVLNSNRLFQFDFGNIVTNIHKITESSLHLLQIEVF